MSQSSPEKLGLFLPRAEALQLKRLPRDPSSLFVDTYNEAPPEMRQFREFNPFHVWPQAPLAVPGTSNERSMSVEAVWQGLKIVDGETDLEQFHSLPKKRPSDAFRRETSDYHYAESLFQYGEEMLPLVKARFLIYAVAYLQLLDQVVSEELIFEILTASRSGRTVIFYDWDSNGNILDPGSSYSHSSLLASWFNGEINETLVEPARAVLATREFDQFRNRVGRYTNRYCRFFGDVLHA